MGKKKFTLLKSTLADLDKMETKLAGLKRELGNLRTKAKRRKKNPTQQNDYSREIQFDSLSAREISTLLDDLNLSKAGQRDEKIKRLKDVEIEIHRLPVSSIQILLGSFNVTKSGNKKVLKKRLKLCLDGDFFVDMDKRILELENKLVDLESKFGYDSDQIEKVKHQLEIILKELYEFRKTHFEGHSPSEFRTRWIRRQTKLRNGYFSRTDTPRARILGVTIILAILFTIIRIPEFSNDLTKIMLAFVWGLVILTKIWESRPTYLEQEIEKKNKIQTEIGHQFRKEFAMLIDEYEVLKNRQIELSEQDSNRKAMPGFEFERKE